MLNKNNIFILLVTLVTIAILNTVEVKTAIIILTVFVITAYNFFFWFDKRVKKLETPSILSINPLDSLLSHPMLINLHLNKKENIVTQLFSLNFIFIEAKNMIVQQHKEKWKFMKSSLYDREIFETNIGQLSEGQNIYFKIESKTIHNVQGFPYLDVYLGYLSKGAILKSEVHPLFEFPIALLDSEKYSKEQIVTLMKRFNLNPQGEDLQKFLETHKESQISAGWYEGKYFSFNID